MTTDALIDGKGARHVAMVYARTAPGGAWVTLNYNGGLVATNANDYGYTLGTKTIDTFAAAGYTEVMAVYMGDRV